MDRDRPFGVRLVVAAVLSSDNRRRGRIRPERRAEVTRQTAHVTNDVRREDVLIRELTAGFVRLTVLTLAGRFLNVLVRYEKSGVFMTEPNRRTIGVAHLALVAGGHVNRGPAIREILQNRRIEKSIGSPAVRAELERVAALPVFREDRSAHRPESPAIQDRASMHAFFSLLRRHHLDDPAELPSIFSGIIPCQDRRAGCPRP